VGAGIMSRLASTIIGVSNTIINNETTHVVKWLGGWHKKFFPFEFQLIDETDSAGVVHLKMPIKLEQNMNLSARDKILRIIYDLYWAGDPFSRKDIIEKTNLGHETVSSILKELVIENKLEANGTTNNKTFCIKIRTHKDTSMALFNQLDE
jgi:predicted transcriptional regulator